MVTLRAPKVVKTYCMDVERLLDCTGKCCFPTEESIFNYVCNGCNCLNKYPIAYYNRIGELYQKKKKQ